MLPRFIIVAGTLTTHGTHNKKPLGGRRLGAFTNSTEKFSGTYKYSVHTVSYTNEKKLMGHIAHLPGAITAHWWLRTRILEKIGMVYPSLATWCEKFANERFERVEY